MNNETKTCPVCDQGHLTLIEYAEDFAWHGEQLRVEGLEAYQCDTCESEPSFPDQNKRNHILVAEAKRRADGLFTGDQIREIRALLGISQREAAAIFGGGIHAFSKYERGEVIQSAAMDRLLCVTQQFPMVLDFLRETYVGVSDGLHIVPELTQVVELTAEHQTSMLSSNFGGAKVIEQIDYYEEAA